MQQVDPTWVAEVAAWYEAQPLVLGIGFEQRHHYAILEREVFKLFQDMPCAVVKTDDPAPYSTLRGLSHDIEMGSLMVFEGGEEHPYLSRTENVRLRAAHDFYGHYIGRCPFTSLEGELNAFRSQSRFHSVTALAALATEVVGQICWFYRHNFYKGERLEDEVGYVPLEYATQKAVPMPEELWSWLIPGRKLS